MQTKTQRPNNKYNPYNQPGLPDWMIWCLGVGVTLVFIALFMSGCAMAHKNSLFIEDADVVHIQDAVMANASTDVYRYVTGVSKDGTGWSLWGATPAGGGRTSLKMDSVTMMSSGVRLKHVRYVIIDRLVGWNTGVQVDSIPDILDALGGPRTLTTETGTATPNQSEAPSEPKEQSTWKWW